MAGWVCEGNMKPSIYVEPSLTEQVKQFLAREGIGIELVDDEGCGLKVLKTDERAESSLETIYAGGWIACGTALAMADRLGIPAEDLGKLLNHLSVKVRRCSLGCF